MARKATTTQPATNFRKADAFLRLSVVDASGVKHRLPKDLALAITNHVSNNMICKAAEDEEYEFNLVGTVHVVDNEPKEDLKF